MMKSSFLAAAMAAICLSFASEACAESAYSIRFTVAGYSGETALENFPVLVRLADNSPAGFSYDDCAADGADIVFTDDAGSVIPREIDTWNTAGESLVWVRVPVVTNGASFSMRYSDMSVTAQPACQTDGSVWGGAGYYGVWHMNEASAKDSTANHLNGTADASITVIDAKLGKGANFPSDASSSTGIKTTNTLNSAFTSAISFETWACPYVVSDSHALFGKEALATFKVDNGATWFTTPGKTDFKEVNAPISANTWYHLVVTFVPRKSAKVYVNGALAKTEADSAGFANLNYSCPVILGGNQWPVQYYKGILDESRLTTTELSADWIAASYATQHAADFLTASPLIGGAAPILAHVTATPGYTNALLSVRLPSVGAGATSATVTFAYGPEGGTLSTPVVLAAAATDGWTLSTNLTGLAAGMAYRYVFTAENDLPSPLLQTKEGSFTTLAQTAPAISLSDRQVGFNRQSISARIVDIGADGTCDLYFSYGPASGQLPPYTLVGSDLSAGATFSRLLSGLSIGTTYIYSFSATNNLGLGTVETGTFTPRVGYLNPARFHYSSTFTVTGYAGAEVLENFPVLVRLSANSPTGFNYADCAAGGSDLRFADEYGKLIPHEIDTWNTSGESLVWVGIPVLTNQTAFTMYYGSSAPGGAADDGVWGRYVGVWHMTEASGTVADAAGHGLAATPMGNTNNSVAVVGAVGNARQTATSAEKGYLSIPNYNSFGLGDTFTMSGWVKLTGCTAYPRLFSRKNAYTDTNGWEMEMNNGSYTAFAARGRGNSPGYSGTFPTALNSAWSHVVLVYNGATLIVYQNGAKVKSGAITSATDNGLPLSIGCNSNGSETYAQGAFDECRLLRSAASADWVKAEYDQVANASFLTAANVVIRVPVVSVDVLSLYTTATISVEVSPGEGANSASVSFAYGTDAGNLSAPTPVAASATAGQTLTVPLAGLAYGTTYHYAFTLVNDLVPPVTNVVSGTFATLPLSAPELTISDLPDDPESQTVSAAIGLLGGGSSCDLYFAYAPDDGTPLAYAQVATGLGSGATFSRTLTGLESGTTYAYSFAVTNDMGLGTVKAGFFTPGIDFKRPDKNVAEFVRGAKFTVTGYTGTSVLTNFPVLVRLSANSPTGFTYADFYNPGDVPGADLCFLDAAGNGIPHEIDTWNTSGESLVWVTLPTMTNGTEFAMWYRSSKSGSVICPDNAWGDYTGVWHLGEGGDGVQSVYDSTTNALTGVTHANSLAVSSGRIGAARRNSTKSGNSAANGRILVSLGAADSRERAVVDALVPEFSVSLWFSPKAAADWSFLVARKGDDSMEGWGIQFGHNTTFQPTRIWASLGKNDGAYYREFNPGSPYDTQANMNRVTWRKANIVYGSDGYVDFYYDGGAYHTRVQVPLCGKSFESNLSELLARNGSADLAIGGMSASGYGSFNGEMDEVRLRRGKDSSDWVQAEYDAVVKANFLNGGEVVSFAETPRPIATFALADSGAKYVQFSGSIGNCGGEATACDFLAKVWKTSGSEPGTWTNLVSGIAAGVPFSAAIVGLDPETAYSYKLKAVNNLATPTDSEIAEGSFTTGGTGGGGEGGIRARVGNDYVHTFAIDPAVGETTFTFTPPDYISSIRALVVAGGGPGGYQRGGGGGAGGLIYDEALAVTGGATYTVNVGTGGVASASAASYGANGGDSSISLGAVEVVSTTGGGAGGNGATANAVGIAGGSGGGGGGASAMHVDGGTGVSGQGNAGGLSGNYNATYVAGGGGGAGRAGGAAANDSPPSGGSGGQGFFTDISGTPTWYAGGGGGGGAQAGSASNLSSPGGGGDGGGGRGGMAVPSGTVNPSFGPQAVAGTDGLGGGGGGGSDVSGFYQGANGGNGVVIVRYTVQGSGAGSDEPVVSLTGAQYDGDLVISGTYRVAWAGEGAEGADVFIRWGYSPNALSHSVRVATDKVGLGSFAVNIPVDQTTIYLRAAAMNGANEGVSDELFAIYIPEYAGVVPGDNTIPTLSNVTATYVDGLFARVSGTVTSFGEAGAGEDPITGCVVYAYVGTSADPARMAKQGELSVTANEPFSLAITNLVPGVQYYWYLEARNSAGHAIATAVDSFTTVERSLFSTCAVSADQQTFTMRGSLLQIGAGTTYVLVRWNDGEWHDWTLVKTFTQEDSADLSFSSASFRREAWGSVSWEGMCSNECVTAEGDMTGTYWVDNIRSGSASAVDSATYTWQPVDGDWNGSWTNAAHWSCDKADNPGYPQSSSATASFLDCTLANPVTVTVPGTYTIGAFKCFGSTGSSIAFVGQGASASRINCASLPEKFVKSDTVLEFRDMTLNRSSDNTWLVMDETGGSPTNVVIRFSGAILSNISHLTVGAPYSRVEFLNRSSATFSNKFSIGGTNTVVTIDDSTVSSHHFFIPADADGPGMKIRLRGTTPLLRQKDGDGVFSCWNQSHELVYEFQVPVGGYASAPIQMVSTAYKFGQRKGDDTRPATPTFSFVVAKDSPAIYDSKHPITNNVLVTTASGFYTNFMTDPLGVTPLYGGQPLGAFKYGAGGVPLEEGDDVSAARQILLDFTGRKPMTIFIVQ